ncbi:2-succinyl-5-enolpyruvyl-6-hydroxy-3-cyclohexene-1-carboxylic-acid synthase [Curtobacterium flaccumfaciens pv. betae]|uniref:2-succinyl-5-enolpyruvyl-6-hydroxy-3- cyclohexene-1-carboxylic-acid synthase n=1 Tax=Curtobacterium flaccumfaciens TaxID=2035 RepID=UPI002657DB32|nr:2-succinyl-5-enolpyruvyl-6-hydroxy-3-cyclohexene-1-carboxylic-acid synthase [Curtobacterium flaccumfaciens]MCS5512706.1 2-succinyl-5-enolpyruvyl-6-hydroxy-3-cyclohexene-1-carboxylic-acid synthase [Curtobacterium flaccumfaciens pv. betae]
MADGPVGSGSPATDTALALLQELVRAGVTDVVVSPGSRSQALALAAVALERAGGLTVHVRLDERTAGFFALGLAVETHRPAAVVTTSGTAVANLHPAVLEAHHSGVPMIVLSADRPDELRGIGSNQTTVQPGIFGQAVAFVRDVEAPSAHGVDASVRDTLRTLARQAVAAAVGHTGQPGPAQLNVAFREPLSAGLVPEHVSPVPDDEVDLAFATRRAHTGLPVAELTPDDEPGTVVIAGHDAGEDAERIAWELGAPLLAEVSSGARFGRNLVVAYRELLRDPDHGGAVRRAVVLGHPTLSREVPALLQRDGVETIVVRGPAADPFDPARASPHRHGPDAAGASPGNRRRGPSESLTTFVSDVRVTGRTRPEHRAWVGRWVGSSRRILGDGDAGPDLDAKRSADRAERNKFLRDEVALRRRPVDRAMLAEAVWGVTWPHDRLVLGASQLIREADARVLGKKIRVHANRGLAGIDGTVSTALGIAAALEQSSASVGTTRVLLGDLTLLHDLGAFVTGTEERTHRVQVVVGNDHGGAIFRGLEVAKTTPEADMRRMMSTPQHVDVERVVTGLGWEYRRAATWGDLERVLTDPAERVVIEVPLAD